MTVRDLRITSSSDRVRQLEIRLDFISIIMSPMTVTSALIFPGTVDVDRFASALKMLEDACPQLFGELQVAEDKSAVHVRPRKSEATSEEEKSAAAGEGFLNLEILTGEEETAFIIENAEENSKLIDKLIPRNVHIKMKRPDLAMASCDQLPIAAFRVCQMKDHFSVGYRLNHVFFDQGGVVSLFRSLSDVYRSSSPLADGNAVKFVPRVLLAPDAPFESKEDFAKSAPKGYNSDPLDFAAMKFGPPQVNVTLRFRRDAVEKLRSGSATKSNVSSNDLAHAVLLKSLALHAAGGEGVTGASRLRIMFAHNMRTDMGVPSTALGDYVRVETTHCTVDEALSMSFLELAELNRQQLRSRTDDRTTFAKECQ